MIEICGRKIKVEGRLIRIARLDAEKFLFVDDPEPVLAGLRDSVMRIDLFSFIQRLPESLPKHPYPMEWDNLAAVRVSTFDTWWTKQIDAKTRNMVRKAEKKGVTLRVMPFDNALVRGVWEIYNECPVRQGRPFAHFGKDVETIHKEEATYLDRSVFIGAFVGDKMIGFVKLLWDETRTQAGLLNIVSMIRHRDKAPTNALIAQAVRFCAEQKISYLVYSNFAYGKRTGDSLSDFKEHNGFLRINLPRYYVPLTIVGSTAFRLGLHKKLAERLSEPVIARIRELRNSWYSRKLNSATDVLR
jgi:hypothetical protein